jgi:metal-sulfur cluster biosynthetic enzyme
MVVKYKNQRGKQLMAENVTLQDVKEAAGKVKHPAINSTLVDLGIATDIRLEGSTAKITIALPFMAIPDAIKNYFRQTLTAAVGEKGVSLEIETREMNDVERQRFLSLEQANWKGL